MAAGTGLTAPPASSAKSTTYMAFGERGRAHHDLTGRIHDEGIAVEHQLVLTADQIDEHQRNSRLADACRADLPLSLPLLVHFIGRGIDDQQHLRAGPARPLRGLGVPDILAHQDPRLDAVQFDHRGFGAGGEIAFFVEHPVIGQAGLAVICQHRSVADDDRGIVDSRSVVFRIAGDQRDAPNLGFEPLDRARDLRRMPEWNNRSSGGYPETASSGSITRSAADCSRAWFAAAMMREVLPSTSPTTKLSCAMTQRSCRGRVNPIPCYSRANS